jgi:hypothetical protein
MASKSRGWQREEERGNFLAEDEGQIFGVVLALVFEIGDAADAGRSPMVRSVQPDSRT